jgi:hypothetical protein
VTRVATLRVESATPDHAIGSCGSTVYYVWRGVIRLDVMQSLSTATRAAAAEGPLSAVGVVEVSAKVPSSEVRSALSDRLREFGEQGCIASALAIEGRGFRVTTVRNVVVGLALVARPSFAHRVFGSVFEGLSWLTVEVGRRGIALDPLELRAVLEALRSD